MSLEELRGEWERGLTVLAEQKTTGRVQVTAKDAHDRYIGLRYFTFGGESWSVSQDIPSTENPEDIIKWLSE